MPFGKGMSSIRLQTAFDVDISNAYVSVVEFTYPFLNPENMTKSSPIMLPAGSATVMGYGANGVAHAPAVICNAIKQKLTVQYDNLTK